MVILENIDIDIDIDKAILQNIDIDEISNRFKFGISNRASRLALGSLVWLFVRQHTKNGLIHRNMVVDCDHIHM